MGIIHPDCVASVYDFPSRTFKKETSPTFTNEACNDALGHVKATLNVTGVTTSCDSVRNDVVLKQAAQFATGADTSAVYDPHGTGKGYVRDVTVVAQGELQFIRLAGVGGKGMSFYQDTVHFQFRDTSS